MPDISGVCSSVGTFEITSKPRKIASTRIVTSKTSSVLWLMPAPNTSFLPATQAPAVISSDQSSAGSPSGARWSSSAWMFRE